MPPVLLARNPRLRAHRPPPAAPSPNAPSLSTPRAPTARCALVAVQQELWRDEQLVEVRFDRGERTLTGAKRKIVRRSRSSAR